MSASLTDLRFRNYIFVVLHTDGQPRNCLKWGMLQI